MSKSKSNFQNFLPQGAWSLENFEKFQGNWSLFGNFLKNVPKKVKFCQLFAKIIRCTKKNLRKFLKSLLPFPILSIFAIFRPHFHQLFATRRVKPWKFWKNSWLPAEIELLPVENPRKLVIFWKPETEIGFFWHFRLKKSTSVSCF